MLMNRDQSALLVVDIQERLLPHIHEGQAVLDNAVWLVKLAQRLGATGRVYGCTAELSSGRSFSKRPGGSVAMAQSSCARSTILRGGFELLGRRRDGGDRRAQRHRELHRGEADTAARAEPALQLEERAAHLGECGEP